ncbi:hypothetical protein [Legionella yabuuchiae]|uniref:hypothetical protein n=1 Tax=Legionella yabuuchiae TaxID=376727 RepID=UPI001054EA27|nr:hypothetical protein [Legionella yabuuchiae]
MTSQINIKSTLLSVRLGMSFVLLLILFSASTRANQPYILVEETEFTSCDNNVAFVYKISPCRYRYWTKWNQINLYCQKRCLVDSWHYVIQCETRCL